MRSLTAMNSSNDRFVLLSYTKGLQTDACWVKLDGDSANTDVFSELLPSSFLLCF